MGDGSLWVPDGLEGSGKKAPAVLLVLDPTKTAGGGADGAGRRQEATALCAQARESWEGLQLSLQLLGATKAGQVKFWCLQSVVEAIASGHYGQLEDGQRAAVKTALVGWLQEPQNFAADSYVKNKFSVTVVRVFLTGDWPTFFHDLLSFVPTGQHAADIFVRVLQVVDDEVACREAQEDLAVRARNTRVKDMMRQECMPLIVDACFSIVESARENPAMGSVAAACLDVIPAYTAWIDLGLITCERFLGTLSHYLSDPALREGAAQNYNAIVCKQMAPDAKLQLLRQMELIPLLQAGADLLGGGGSVGPELAGFVASLASLTTAFATECMTCIDRIRGAADDAEQFLLGCVPLIATYMRAMDHGPESQCCVAFLSTYLNRVRKMKSRNRTPSRSPATAPHIERVGPLVAMLQDKISYPADFDFESPGDEEEAFIARRKDLVVLFRTCADLDQAAALTSTLAVVNSLSDAGTTFVAVELALTLLLQMTEAERATKGRMALEIEGAKNARDSAVAAILTAGVELCGQFTEQRCVAAAYLRLARGSGAVLRDQLTAVTPVLNVFFGTMKTSDGVLALEAAKIFVKWLQKEGGAALISELCFDEAFGALLDLLQQRPAVELAESIGLMISVDPSRAHQLESVMVPVLSQLEHQISLAQTSPPENVDLYIVVCAYVCKGFCSKKTMGALGAQPREAVAGLLFGAVEMAVKAVDTFPAIPAARSGLITLIRSCLAVVEFNELLPCLPAALHAIIVSAGQAVTTEIDGVVEVLELVSGFATRYKAEIAPMLAIPGLMEAVVDLALTAAAGLSAATGSEDDEHDRAELVRGGQKVRKSLSYFLFWVSNCGLTEAIVGTAEMKARLPGLLHAIALSVQTKPVEHPHFKNGFVSIARLLQCWVGAGSAAAAGGGGGGDTGG
eukprot:SAG22_NODE_1994_length_3189_cov_3.276375_2_plen_910_part_01